VEITPAKGPSEDRTCPDNSILTSDPSVPERSGRSESHKMNSRGPVVLFQAPNHVGLGHLNRMSCIADALRSLDPAVRPLFVIDGHSHGVLESFKLPHFSLPHHSHLLDRETWPLWTTPEIWRMSTALADSILDTSGAALIVYDSFPSLSFIWPVLRRKIKTVLIIRKMRDLDTYLESPRMRPLLQSGCSVIVPHDKDEFLLPEPLNVQAVYVGPIVKPLPVQHFVPPLHAELNRQRIIVITAGGGGAPGTSEYFNRCLQAFGKLRSKLDNIVAYLVTGPLFSDWSNLSLLPEVRIIPFDPQLATTCSKADLVVSQAGYNSVNELTAIGVPTIYVPTICTADDQFERARLAAAKHPNTQCYEGNSVDELAILMEKQLIVNATRTPKPQPDGAIRAAQHILSLLGRNS
jgi:spore coat polysaccharide biosynthesis predicted glycosyltransferase SpsG